MKKIITVVFFGFICWVIYIADTDNNHVLLKLMESVPHADKANHLLLFGLLTFLLNISFPKFRIKGLFGGTFLVALFCIIEETSQLYFPTRNFDLFDLVFDFIGITIFTFLSSRWLARQWLRDKQKSQKKLFPDLSR